MDLRRDAFRVTYDRAKVSQETIRETIKELGFQPRIDLGDEPPRPLRKPPSAVIPEPIATALEEARASAKLVFVDFYAEWCAPCKIIEAKVLPDSRVQEALEGFVFVRVDTDTDPEAGQRFEVDGMPTLLVLDGEGGERYRQVGLIEPGELAEKLRDLARAVAY